MFSKVNAVVDETRGFAASIVPGAANQPPSYPPPAPTLALFLLLLYSSPSSSFSSSYLQPEVQAASRVRLVLLVARLDATSIVVATARADFGVTCRGWGGANPGENDGAGTNCWKAGLCTPWR